MAIGPVSSDGFGTVSVLAGGAAGIGGAVVVGAVIQFGFDPLVLSRRIPEGVGLSGLVAGWAVLLAVGAGFGTVYAALARIDRVGVRAGSPGSGAALGLGYGVVLWGLAVVIVPLLVGAGPSGIGDYAFSSRGVLAFGLLGTLIGLGYAISPANR